MNSTSDDPDSYGFSNSTFIIFLSGVCFALGCLIYAKCRTTSSIHNDDLSVVNTQPDEEWTIRRALAGEFEESNDAMEGGV